MEHAGAQNNVAQDQPQLDKALQGLQELGKEQVQHKQVGIPQLLVKEVDRAQPQQGAVHQLVVKALVVQTHKEMVMQLGKEQAQVVLVLVQEVLLLVAKEVVQQVLKVAVLQLEMDREVALQTLLQFQAVQDHLNLPPLHPLSLLLPPQLLHHLHQAVPLLLAAKLVV